MPLPAAVKFSLPAMLVMAACTSEPSAPGSIQRIELGGQIYKPIQEAAIQDNTREQKNAPVANPVEQKNKPIDPAAIQDNSFPSLEQKVAPIAKPVEQKGAPPNPAAREQK